MTDVQPVGDHCGYRFKGGAGCFAGESHPVHHGGWEKVRGIEPNHDFVPESHEWAEPMCRWCGRRESEQPA